MNTLSNVTLALKHNTFYNANTRHRYSGDKTTTTVLTNTLPLDILNFHMSNLIFDNYKTLYSNVTKNRLLLMEALFIKPFKSELGHGLNASKELSIFKAYNHTTSHHH